MRPPTVETKMEVPRLPTLAPILQLATLAALVLASGCGTKNVGSKLAPKDPSATEALGETIACTSTNTVAEPYVVDLRGADRSHLEAVMTEGIAIVRYDCEGLQVLRGCTVRGAPNPYTFVGVSMKEDQVQIDTLDQLKANLPASAVKLEAELTSGAAIDIGLVMVGRKSIRGDMVAKADLDGPGCEGATHFVRSAIVGAFAVEKGTQGKARAAAEIFGAGAAAGSEANRRVANRDGKREDCNNAHPGDPTPPEQCRAAITIELYPIVEERPALAEGDAEGGGEDSQKEAIEALDGKCANGFVRSSGKCAPASQVATYQCKPGDFDECKTQCEKGNGPSCYNYGVILRSGTSGRERDPAAAQQVFLAACDAEDGPAKACFASAFELSKANDWSGYIKVLQRGCDRGDANACDMLGNTMISGRKGLDADTTRGISLLERACGMGRKGSCSQLALSLIRTKVDEERGVGLLQRSCDAGERNDCVSLGFSYDSGSMSKGKQPAEAHALRLRACDLGDVGSCTRAGQAMLAGTKPIKKDVKGAIALLEKGCPETKSDGPMMMNPQACRSLAEAHRTGQGVPASGTAAKAVLERGCSGKRRLTCVDLATLLEEGAKGLPKDPAEADKILRHACDEKDITACTAVGKRLEKHDKGIARAFYEDACARTRFPPLCTSAEKLGGKGLPATP